jgi:hypothetical protein
MNILNTACAVLAIASCASGCTTPAPPASDSVRVTTKSADVAGCNLLGKVVVSETSPDVARAARDQTMEVGGNVLLRKNDQVWNGNAYLCPAGHLPGSGAHQP